MSMAVISNHLANQRRPLLIAQCDPSTASKQAKAALDDPNESEDSKDEGRPVDEARLGLVCEDCPEGPGDGDGGREVAFRGGEGVCGCGGLKEEAREEGGLVDMR